jgi:hypothetical protein
MTHASHELLVRSPNKGLQLRTDSWAFQNSVAFWRRDFCNVALTVSAVCCS